MSKGPETPTQAPPNQERQPSDSVTLVYRDNSLFQRNVPKIVKILESLGKKVAIKSVPAEMVDYEALQNAWNEIDATSKEEMFKGQVITDYTFSNFVGEGKNENEFDGGGLDELLDGLATESIMGEQVYAEYKATFAESGSDWAKAEKEKQVLKEAIKTCFRRILENPSQKPNRVIVLQDNLIDHAPFAEEELEDEEAVAKAEQGAANELKGLLAEAGIGDDEILVTNVMGIFGKQNTFVLNATSEALKGPWTEMLKSITAEQKIVWIVTDRHVTKRTPDFEKSLSEDTSEFLSIPNVRIILLTVPLSNLVADLKEKNLVEITEDDKRLVTKLRERLGL